MKTDDLRSQIADLENKRIILESERDDVSYSALVDRDPKAVKRAAEIGDELASLSHRESMLNAALREAIRREADAEATDAAERRRAAIAQAQAMLTEVATMAAQIDNAIRLLHDTTVAFEAKWAEIKKLSGAGPLPAAARIHITRAFQTGLRGLPGLKLEFVMPAQRTTVSKLSAAWSEQIRKLSSDKPATVDVPPRKSNKAAA